LDKIPVPSKQTKPLNKAIRKLASTIGAIVGLAGMEHGLFEALQGGVTTNSLIIDAIGPSQELWAGATEPALTIVPNFFASGVLAMVVGFLVVVWAVTFIQRKYGAPILLFLSILLFLVGGGSPPIFLGIVASAVATQINKPLTWWRANLSDNVRGFLAKLWPWSIIAFVLLFWFAVLTAITGVPLVLFFDPETTDFLPTLNALGYISDVIMLLAVFAGFAFDIQRRTAE
jgi:hypothetical protein